MMELLSEAFRLVNLPFTILLILVIVYWLLVALGALGGPAADADLDVHANAHIDHEVDIDTMHHNVEGHHGHGQGDSGSWWGTTLKFVNLGDVPVMVVLSVLILSMWCFGMIFNHYWARDSYLLAIAFVGVNFLISVVVTRYVTLPLKPVFRMLNKQFDESVQIVGRHCRIVTSEATPNFGQAEIATDGVPLLIHVRTMNDAVMQRGDVAVIVREDADTRIFFITPNPAPANH